MASEVARALVAAELGGDLETAEHDVTVTLRRPGRFLELPYGPVTAVREVSLLASYHVTPFGLERLGDDWPADTRIAVSYDSGWVAGDEPGQVKAALELVDRWLATEPESGVTSVKMTDFSVTRSEVTGLPVVAKALLRAWVRPCL